ncbi:MAG: glycosyl hydrolase, partial [Gemmatimonadetes bacterium]|nr:glycosyl hydrolase [Gemmatimonadota bacterium]
MYAMSYLVDSRIAERVRNVAAAGLRVRDYRAASGTLRRIFGERLTAEQKDFPMFFPASIFAAAMVFASMTATVAATASIARAQAPAPRFKVLVIAELVDPRNAGENEIHRPYVEAAKTWLAKLAADSNFTVSYLESPNTITDAMLSTVDVIWQMNYTPFRWNATAKAALEKYLDGGKGGWLGDHHASLYGSAVTSETWPWFDNNLLGGINYKNYGSRFASGTVRVEDSAHPVLKDVPANFRIATEEWYIWDRSP